MDERGVSVDRLVRWTAAAGFVGAVAQVFGGVVETVDGVGHGEPGFEFRTAVIAVAYALLAAAMVGLARSAATGPGLAARVGSLAAASGFAVQAVAQIVLWGRPELAEMVLFPVGSVLIGVGLVAAGIGVLRTARWRGARRGAPLVCGLYQFLVIFPAIAIAGGPVFLVFAGWGVCLAWLTAALWTSASRDRGAHESLVTS